MPHLSRSYEANCLTQSVDPRALCWKCRRAQSACFCSQIQPFQSDVRFVILLHPKEFKRRIGTVRIVELALPGPNGTLVLRGNAQDLDHDPRLLELVADTRYDARVLFPGKHATDLRTSEDFKPESTPPGQLGLRKKLLILVIDGTWPQAKKMIRESRILGELPQVAFEPRRESSYRFREQPQPGFVSTVEAVHETLEILHQRGIAPLPEHRPHDGLLKAFDWLVEFQLRAQAENQAGRERPS